MPCASALCVGTSHCAGQFFFDEESKMADHKFTEEIMRKILFSALFAAIFTYNGWYIGKIIYRVYVENNINEEASVSLS